MIIIGIPIEFARRVFKKGFQIGQHFVATAHDFHHAGHVVRHEPTLLVGIALHATVPLLQASFFRPVRPRAVGVAHAEPSLFLIEYFTVCLSAPVIDAGILRLAQSLGPFAHTPIEVSVFQRFRYAAAAGRISQFRMVPDAVGCLTGKAVSFLHVVSAYAFHIGIDDDGYGRITQHAAAVSVQELPTFVHARTVFLGQSDKRVDHVVHHFRIDKVLQGELAAEHIPTAEHRTLLECIGLVHLPVSSHVFTRHVAIVARVYHRVVQRSIKNRALIFRPSGDFDFRQGLVPQRSRLFAIPLEVLSPQFGFEVRLRSFQTDKGDGRAHQHLFAFARGELRIKSQMVSLHAVGTFRHLRPAYSLGKFRRSHVFQLAPHALGKLGRPYAVTFQRLTETGVKVNRIIGLPSPVAPTASVGRATHPSADGIVVHTLHVLPDRRTAHAASQVDLNARTFVFRISETHDPAVRSGRQFRPDVIIGQADSVISGTCRLALLIVTRTVALLRTFCLAAIRMQRPRGGHH